jgi:hypothetical protein
MIKLRQKELLIGWGEAWKNIIVWN